MSVVAVDVVRELYGYNWASLGSRREGLAIATQIFAEGFSYQLDPTLFGTRALTRVQDIELFLQAFETDFRELRQRPDKVLEAPANAEGERVVVLGEIIGRGRLSGLPFRSPFGHVWTLRDGRIAKLEGYLDHEVALAAGGLDDVDA